MQAKLLRGLTGSRFDHVAVIIKYHSGQVVVFESLDGKGVSRWDWNYFWKSGYWQKNYSKIVFRRLQGVERNDTFKAMV